jgi:hypothetical protein
MTFGPGKYDDVCDKVRTLVGVDEFSGGGVVVIVIGGSRGAGFAVQADLETSMQLPDMLESVAKQMRKDLVG